MTSPSHPNDRTEPARDESPWALAAARARSRVAEGSTDGHGPRGETIGMGIDSEARAAERGDSRVNASNIASTDHDHNNDTDTDTGTGTGTGTDADADAAADAAASTEGAEVGSPAGTAAPNPMSPREATALPAPRGAPVRKPTWRFLFEHPAHVVGLGFGSGLSRWAPGTLGTLWAWLVFRLLAPHLDDAAWAAVITASLLVGWWACTVTARDMAVADPGAVVWDEVIAFWLVLWLIGPTTLWGEFCAFALFRFFDAAKPGPVAWADALFKGRRGGPIGWAQGFGIIFDDLVAALCALLVIAIWRMW